VGRQRQRRRDRRNATGLVFPSTISLLGGNEDANNRAHRRRHAVGLRGQPAGGDGSGEGGALGLSLGSIGGNFNINLRRVRPRGQGHGAHHLGRRRSPCSTTSSRASPPACRCRSRPCRRPAPRPSSCRPTSASRSRRPCRRATARSRWRFVVQKNEPDFVNVGARGDPTILRKEAHTSMLVADGETSRARRHLPPATPASRTSRSVLRRSAVIRLVVQGSPRERRPHRDPGVHHAEESPTAPCSAAARSEP